METLGQVQVQAPFPHSLRAFRGRQPLCGTGVLSVIEITSRPPMVSPLMADWKDQKQAIGMVFKKTVQHLQTGLWEGWQLTADVCASSPAASTLCFTV